ncbi:hypothetical protein [Ancylobacter oerskovii]|uniref:Uncharacterized protein n=1 Tax=Ancylobacter oerskovii TaxID=459519 RepID=A0ABW4YRS9_9HYPH|nr:hypothetical protein [Ancylobacter oerskovii]MBS7545671.1 hypothetical protein [Ancylobacter oerskovii]
MVLEHPDAADLRRQLKANSEEFMRLSIADKADPDVLARFLAREERLVERFRALGLQPSFPREDSQ